MSERITLDKRTQEMLWNELREQDEVTVNLLRHDVRFIIVPDGESDFLDMINEIESYPELRGMLIASKRDILRSAEEVITHIKSTYT
jgi:hypothetical protein